MWARLALIFFTLISLALAQDWPAGWPNQAIAWPDNPATALQMCNVYGSICYSCNTRLTCDKKQQAKLKPCNDLFFPYCYLGKCYATPYGECAVQANAKLDNEGPVETLPEDATV